VSAALYFSSGSGVKGFRATTNSQLAAAANAERPSKPETAPASAASPVVAVPVVPLSKDEPKTTWTAMSRTAMAITGDVGLTSSTITIKNTDYPLKLVREVAANDLADTGKIVNEEHPSAARLYNSFISKTAVLLNGNTICGPDEDATWTLAVYTTGDKGLDTGLSLAFFTGSAEPSLNYQTVSTGHDLCATFAYVP
jgi:hypothetical protein